MQNLRSAIDVQARKQASQHAQTQAAEREARSAIEESRSAFEESRSAFEESRSAFEARLANLASEFRERDEQLSAEQRVCFKQLSLEVSEAAVWEDRGRRAILSRLEKLESRSPNKNE